MQFKTLALATTSLVALGLAVAPASAKSGMTGNMSLGTGYTEQNEDDGGENIGDIDDRFWNIFGGAKVNHAYNENVNFQADIAGEAAYANEDNTENFGTTFGVVGHLNYSNESGFLGVFGATGRSSSIDDDTVSYFAAGFEGEFTGANWTAGGQLGWLDSCCGNDTTDTPDGLQQAGFVRIDGAFYPNPDIRIGASGAYIDGTRETSPELDVTMWEWTASAEKMIGRNTSVVLEYRGLLAEETDGTENDYDSHSVNLAFVFHFNATNVYASHVDGASAQTLRFGRWVSEGGEQLD